MSNVHKNKLFAAALLIPAIFSGCSDKNSESPYSKDIFAMDTFMNIKAYGSNAQNAADLAEKEIIRLEALLSVNVPESDISRINKSNDGTVVSADTISIIQKAVEVSGKTDGALDITVYPLLAEWGFTTGKYNVPSKERISELLENVDYKKIKLDTEKNSVCLPERMSIELGAAAKGYTGDRVRDILKENGIESAIINLGGNVCAIGRKPDGSEWTVGIKDPNDTGEIICTVKVENKSVITSGNYERFFVGDDGHIYGHIIDTKTGYPVDNNGILSVTIIGSDGTECDALSTALFVMGKEKALEFCRQEKDLDAVIAGSDGRLYITEEIYGDTETAGNIDTEVIKRYE